MQYVLELLSYYPSQTSFLSSSQAIHPVIIQAHHLIPFPSIFLILLIYPSPCLIFFPIFHHTPSIYSLLPSFESYWSQELLSLIALLILTHCCSYNWSPLMLGSNLNSSWFFPLSLSLLLLSQSSSSHSQLRAYDRSWALLLSMYQLVLNY